MDKSEAKPVTLSAAVQEAIRRNNKIEAIKQLREELNIGLKEAKDIIDDQFDQYREVQGIQRGRGNPSFWIALIIAAIVLLFLIFR